MNFLLVVGKYLAPQFKELYPDYKVIGFGETALSFRADVVIIGESCLFEELPFEIYNQHMIQYKMRVARDGEFIDLSNRIE